MIHLVTFASPEFTKSAKVCVDGARWHGALIDSKIWTPDDLKINGFSWKNKDLLDEPRGFGFWSWKSFVILHTLSRIPEGEIVCYADAGVEIINNLNYITDRMTSDIWLFGNQYQHAHWCKRDIIEAIWPGAPWESFAKQCQASVIFIRNSEYSRKFVKEWLEFCTVKHLIDDSPSIAPNHPEFQENRHDQAILTTLAYREGISLHYWPAQYNGGQFVYERGDYPDEGYPVLFHHHRRRNSEYKDAA